MVVKRDEGVQFLGMRMWKSILAMSVGPLLLQAGEADLLQKSEMLFREGLALEQLMVREKSEWREEKMWLEQQIALYERELARLEESYLAEEEALNELRGDVQEQEANFAGWTAELEAGRVFLEQEQEAMRALLSDLPMRLPDSWRAWQSRLDRENQATVEDLRSGTQLIVAILLELDRWDGQTRVTREELVLGGEDFSAEVMWLGLSQAFYRLPHGEGAGRGFRVDGVWQWEPLDGRAAQEVSRLFASWDGPVAGRPVLLPLETPFD